MPLAPVARVSLSDAVFGALRDLILRGEIRPGEALPSERALCQSFEVNRGALREALKRLEQLGLVVIRSGEPTRVVDFRDGSGLEVLPDLLVGPDAQLRREAIQGLIEMRSALGPDIARLAALRHTEGELAVVQAHLAVMQAHHQERAGVVELQRASMQLWGELVLASHNLAYRLTYNTWKTSWEPVQDLIAPVLAAEVEHLKGYEQLVRAVAEHKPELAARHATRLLSRGHESLERWLAAMFEPRRER